jgi:hypothetical protein
MGSSQKSTSTTTSANPNITDTTNKLLGGIDSAWAKGPSVFNESLYAGLGDTTKNGISQMIGSANNPAYANGVQGAISSFGKTASGANLGVNDPGYSTIRNKLSNDVLTSTNGSFNNSGLFGSDNNQKQAASGLADSLGALDYQQYNDSQDRQVQAAGLLPGLYQASQAPASTMLSAGAIQDADRQAALQGRYDLSTRQGNAQTDLLAKLSSILAGNAASAGTTKTETKPSTPWWQTVGQLAVGAF